MRKYDDRDIDTNPDQEDVPSPEELEAEDREWDRQIAAKPDVLSRLVTQAKKNGFVTAKQRNWTRTICEVTPHP
jgi:hypothetical protein